MMKYDGGHNDQTGDRDRESHQSHLMLMERATDEER